MNAGSNKIRRKHIIFLAALVLCVSLIALPTLTFVRHQLLSKNIITMDNGIKIELLEHRLNEQGEEVAFEDVNGVLPGKNYSKIVKVKNTGDQPAFIRVKVHLDVTLSSGEQESLSDSSLVELDYSNKWQKSGDYWYYPLPLSGQAVTEPLFRTVTFSPNMGKKYMNSTIKVQVKSYATQVKHNGTHVFDAQGWPAD